MRHERMKLLLMTLSVLSSAAVADDPKETAIDSAEETLNEIKESFEERAWKGIKVHDLMGKGCDKEKGNKVDRRQRITDQIAYLTSAITQDTAEVSALKFEESKLEEELSELEQSLLTTSKQLVQLDEDFTADDAQRTTEVNAMAKALESLESKAALEEPAQKELLQKAAVLLAARLQSKTVTETLDSDSALDVVIGTIKAIIDNMKKEQKEGEVKYRKTRLQTAVLLETLSKSAEAQAQHLATCKAKLGEVGQRLESSKEERETLNTKVKGNEDILQEYWDFCGDMAKLQARHERRMNDAAQATGTAQTAISKLRPAMLLSKKRQMFRRSHFVPIAVTAQWLLPREDNSSDAQKLEFHDQIADLTVHEIGQSLAHAAGLPTFVGEGVAKMVSRVRHAFSNLQKHPIVRQGLISDASDRRPLSKVAPNVDGSSVSPEVLAAVSEGPNMKVPRKAGQPFQKSNSSQVLLLSDAHCQDASHAHPEPASLAASWVLEHAAKDLHSIAIKRVACVVRQRNSTDAKQMLLALGRSLQTDDPGNDAGPDKSTSECEQKKMEVNAELRTAEKDAMTASADVNVAKSKLKGLNQELGHLSPYLPKLKADKAGLKSGKTLFKSLHDEDAAEAEAIEKDVSGIMDDLADGVQDTYGYNYEKALQTLLKLIKALPDQAEKDMKVAQNGVNMISEKLSIRESLVDGWISDLGEKIKTTDVDLKEATSRKDETAAALADALKKADFSCVEPKPESESTLLLHQKHMKAWTRDIELSAINLASSLLK